MPDNDKLDAIFAAVHEMKPMLADVRDGQKSTEARLRASEISQAEHGVKIERLQTDFDGLGRKVRAVETRILAPAAPAVPAPARESKFSWTTIIEFLSAAPTLAHFVITVFIGLGAIAAAFWRHGP